MTVKNKYLLPLISKLINKLRGAKYFTKLDVRWGFNNVRMKEGDEWKAAFRTNRGLFEPLVMFFGLCNSLTTFQTMMDDIFDNLITEGVVVVYLDDILIFTETLEEHRRVTRRVMELLQKNDLFLKPEKCEFEKTEVEYLRVIISQNSVKMDSVKVAGVMEWPTPSNRKEVQSFLGFTNFYHRFIQGFSHLARLSWSVLGHVLSKEQSKDGADGVSDDGRLTIVQCHHYHRPPSSDLYQSSVGILPPLHYHQHNLHSYHCHYQPAPRAFYHSTTRALPCSTHVPWSRPITSR